MQPWKGAPMWEAKVIEGRMEMLTVEQMWDRAVPVHPMVLFKEAKKDDYYECLAGQAFLLSDFNFTGLIQAVRDNGFGRIDVLHLAKAFAFVDPECPKAPIELFYMTLVVIEHEGVCKAFRLFSLDRNFAMQLLRKDGHSLLARNYHTELQFCFVQTSLV